MSRIIPKDSDTICAESTPTGRGGISVIRVSGDKAWDLATTLAPQLVGKKIESHRCYLAKAVGPDGSELDEALFTFFEKNRSFTGDRVVEISCHGSPLIVDSLLRSLIHLGARAADRGEFTYRAFMNGKLDLVQAESVLGLIESNSKKAAELSLRQLGGHLSQQLISYEDTLIWSLAHLEASIDFSTEDIEVVDHSLLRARLTSVQQGLSRLVSSFQQGRRIAHGFRLVILGAPNVGKSSLLNRMLEKDKAIVTDIAGTTRDLIEDSYIFKGRLFTIVDTAGIRESSDVVERIGIKKSLDSLKSCDAVLFVYDVSRAADDADLELLKQLLGLNLILVGNKRDLLLGEDRFLSSLNEKNFQRISELKSIPRLQISSFDEGDGLKLKEAIYECAKEGTEDLSVMLSNSRHFEALSKALLGVERALEILTAGTGAEFVAVELKDSLLRVQETLGHRFDDQILDRVFKEFCVGK
jgi:tRNA modification GTPase